MRPYIYLVDAARHAEAAEAGVVQQPGHEQPRLAGHEAHHQQEAGEQTCGGRGSLTVSSAIFPPYFPYHFRRWIRLMTKDFDKQCLMTISPF